MSGLRKSPGPADGQAPQPSPGDLVESLSILRAQMQDQIDSAELLVERLRQADSDSEVAAQLECLLADRLAPALQNFAALEASALRLHEVPR